MNEKELREKTKHRTFTSMAQRRRWLALHEEINKKEEAYLLIELDGNNMERADKE